MASLEPDTVYMALIRANQFATDDCHLPFTFALAYRIATYVKNDQDCCHPFLFTGLIPIYGYFVQLLLTATGALCLHVHV